MGGTEYTIKQIAAAWGQTKPNINIKAVALFGRGESNHERRFSFVQTARIFRAINTSRAYRKRPPLSPELFRALTGRPVPSAPKPPAARTVYVDDTQCKGPADAALVLTQKIGKRVEPRQIAGALETGRPICGRKIARKKPRAEPPRPPLLNFPPGAMLLLGRGAT
jgi:hypothetical protein